MCMRLRNNRGAALVLTLMVTVVLIILGSIFVMRTINEWNAARKEKLLTQSFYVAEGGAESGLNKLDTLINTDLLNTINATSPATVISNVQSYVSSGNGLTLLTQYVKSAGVAQFTLSGTAVIHQVASTALGPGSYGFDIVITEKSNPVSSGLDQWDFPYYYRVQSTGTASATSRKVLLSGDFTVRVQRDNFAKYALFTNQDKTPTGVNVWFTDKTNFAGPIHTNDRHNFALNPSGTFEGLVTQSQTTAQFYNNGSPVLINANLNGTKDVPTFHAGFNRGVPTVALSSSVQKQDMIDEATGNTTITTDGIYVPNSGTALTGGIYVKGNASVALSVNGSDQPVYTITQGSTTKIITVNQIANETTVQTGATSQTYTGIPD